MKKVLPFLLATLVLNSCRPNKAETAKAAMRSLLAKNSRHTSISYHVNFRMKYLSNSDTIHIQGTCKLVKDAKDTLFGGYVWFNSLWGHRNFIKYYDLDSIYIIDDSLKSITSYNKPSTEYWAITGNTAGSMINTFFLDTSTIHKALSDTSIVDTLSQDKIGNTTYWKVTIKYKDDKETSNCWRCIWINPADTTLRKITFHCTFQEKDQYQEWNLDSVQYDKETPQTLKSLVKSRFSSYTMKPYIPPNPELEKLLAKGLKAPAFSGTDFATGKKIKLADYKNKIVLLDFWYMDCPWCIKAMPLIEKVRDEYDKRGLVVLGINSFDTSQTQKQQLPQFIQINKNTYPTILTSHSTDKLYNVNGYPTFYLIDKKGKIAYSQRGYCDKMDSIFGAEINKIE